MLKNSYTNTRWIYTLLIWAMFVGMMWSRALLSIMVLVFPLVSLWLGRRYIRQSLKAMNKFVGFFLMLLIASLSFIWTQDLSATGQALMNQFMWILIPLGMIGMPWRDAKWRYYTLMGIALIHLIVMIQAGVVFLMDVNYWMSQYNTMGTLAVGKYNDHIRFSLSVLLLNILLIEELSVGSVKSFKKYGWIYIYIVVSILFIHLLASKSGVILLYLGIFVASFLYIRKRSFKLIFASVVVILMSSLYWVTPTLQKKVDMVTYQWREYKEKGRLNYQHSDQGRIISYQVGWEAIQQNPWWGVGAGAMPQAMEPIYHKKYPEIPSDHFIIPHNQWLSAMLSYGIILGAIYPFLLAIPLKQRRHSINKGEILSLFLIFASMIPEATLESQFGVFIVVFYLAWNRVVKKK